MASYTELKRMALRLRREAIKKEIPSQYLAFADAKIDKAIFSRTRPDKEALTSFEKKRGYDRAKTELSIAIDILNAHIKKLYEYEREVRYKFLANELCKSA
jgi:hypothetical protein